MRNRGGDLGINSHVENFHLFTTTHDTSLKTLENISPFMMRQDGTYKDLAAHNGLGRGC